MKEKNLKGDNEACHEEKRKDITKHNEEKRNMEIQQVGDDSDNMEGDSAGSNLSDS